jgi:type VI secretion system protein ImpE
MSDALEHLRRGDPEAALQSLQAVIRAQPADARHRVFLFQLLCVLGRWDRALTQLNLAGDLDAGTLGMVQVYREALASEALRAEVFAGQRSPLVFGEPAPWIAWLVEAVRLGATGQHAQSQDLRGRALEQAPATSGQLDGEPFEWIADADPRLGPILELIVNGRYYWVPFQRIAQIKLEPPADLRDLVWLPAELKWSNGGEAVGLIPTRYPGSESAADPLLKLARKTEWQDVGSELFHGLGQRMLATDAGERPLLDVKSVVLATAGADGA